jgi:hypothetical protein
MPGKPSIHGQSGGIALERDAHTKQPAALDVAEAALGVAIFGDGDIEIECAGGLRGE